METIGRISVLITAYKNAELVKRCVDSLRESFGGVLPETVIVDDAAGDKAIAELAASYAADGVKFAVMPDCTVLVCSCDKYADLHGPFIALLRKFWSDCPFEVVLVTESDSRVEGFDRLVLTGVGKPWCAMLSEALERVATDFVLLLMDDYLLEAPVDTSKILHRLEEARRFGAASVRLNPNPPGRRPVAGTDLLEMPKNVAYCVTCQTSIWRRDFLLGLTRQNKSAWEFERYGSFQVGDETRPLLVTPTKEFPFIDAVHKGYWEKFGVKCLADNNIDYDFSKRGLPPFKVRVIEGLKAFIFVVVPNNWIVRVQNAFGLGAKEKSAERCPR